MPHAQTAGGDFGPHLIGQLQEPQIVRNGRAVLSDSGGDIFLRQLELVGKAPIRERLVYRIQIFALNVLDERELEPRPVAVGRDVADGDGDAKESGELGGAPAPFAGDDLEPIANAPDDDRLNDPVRAN